MATAITSFSRATEPASAQGRALEHRAQAFLLCLTRAVQRASIYPPGHPAVSQGVAPLLAALHALVDDEPVTVAVGRTHLLVSGGDRPPTEHDAPWLAGRLFDRQLSAVTIHDVLDAPDLARFVAWLSAGDTGDLPEGIAGLTMARFDGRRVRFRETDEGRVDTPEALATWHVLTASLRSTCGIGEQETGGDDPRVLGDRIRDVLHASEGTGVAALTDQLVEMHQQARALDSESRALVADKLATLVNGLSPELRGTLLTTSRHDDPSKLSLVEDLLPFVSPSVLSDIASSVVIDAEAMQGPFARFLRKLSCLSALDPRAGEALDSRMCLASLPASLVRGHDIHQHDATADRTAVDQQVKGVVPPKYGARLEQLTTGVVDPATEHPTLVVPVFDDAELDEHLARIALLQLRRDLTGADTTACLQWLADLLPRECDRGGVGVLCGVADVVLRLRAAADRLTPETRALLARCEGAFAEPAAVTLAIDAIGALPVEGPDLPAALLLAGGGAAAGQALAWLRTATDAGASGRVAAVVASVEPDLFKRAVAPQLGENLPAAEAMVGALDHVDPARAMDVGIALATHSSAAVRHRATTWLLSVPLSHARLHRVLQRAFDDPDPAIVTLALDTCVHRPSTAVSDVLTFFVSRRAPVAVRPLQARATRVLGDSGADGLARLAGVLQHRRWVLRHGDRQLSVTMAQVLAQGPSTQGRAASRSWRWSPAGLLSVFTTSADQLS